MSMIGMNPAVILAMLLKKMEKDAQKALTKEAKSLGDAIAKSITQEALDSGIEKFLEQQVKRHLPKVDKIVLGAVAGQFRKAYDASKLPPDPSGFDPSSFKAFAPVYQPKPLSKGTLNANIPIPLKKLTGPKGRKVALDVWLGVDQGKLLKRQWGTYGGAKIRF